MCCLTGWSWKVLGSHSIRSTRILDDCLDGLHPLSQNELLNLARRRPWQRPEDDRLRHLEASEVLVAMRDELLIRHCPAGLELDERDRRFSPLLVRLRDHCGRVGMRTTFVARASLCPNTRYAIRQWSMVAPLTNAHRPRSAKRGGVWARASAATSDTTQSARNLESCSIGPPVRVMPNAPSCSRPAAGRISGMRQR